MMRESTKKIMYLRSSTKSTSLSIDSSSKTSSILNVWISPQRYHTHLITVSIRMPLTFMYSPNLSYPYLNPLFMVTLTYIIKPQISLLNLPFELIGINSTVFMYGQTGSGKTYTTLGPFGDSINSNNL